MSLSRRDARRHAGHAAVADQLVVDLARGLRRPTTRCRGAPRPSTRARRRVSRSRRLSFVFTMYWLVLSLVVAPGLFPRLPAAQTGLGTRARAAAARGRGGGGDSDSGRAPQAVRGAGYFSFEAPPGLGGRARRAESDHRGRRPTPRSVIRHPLPARRVRYEPGALAAACVPELDRARRTTLAAKLAARVDVALGRPTIDGRPRVAVYDSLEDAKDGTRRARVRPRAAGREYELRLPLRADAADARTRRRPAIGSSRASRRLSVATTAPSSAAASTCSTASTSTNSTAGAGLRRQLLEVGLVLARQDDRADAGALGGEHLLADAADGSTWPVSVISPVIADLVRDRRGR